MTREELWKTVCKQNPSFAGTEPITLTPKGLRKMFDLAYEQGKAQSMKDLQRLVGVPKNPFDNIFNGMWK
jgi:hypothetical protein